MNNKALAKIILKDLGGEENIISFIHTKNHLMFNLKDRLKIDDEHLRQIRAIESTFVINELYSVVTRWDNKKVFKCLKIITQDDKKKRFFKKIPTDEITIYSPVKGEIINKDNELAIKPRCKLAVSPIDAIIREINSKKTEFTLEGINGIVISVGIGENIESLRSDHITALKKMGDKVKCGDAIFEFEPTAMKVEGCEPIIKIKVDDSKDFHKFYKNKDKIVECEPLIYFKR